MDKALTKTVMMHHGIATLPFIGFAHREWKTNSHKILKEIELELKFPVFVKPAHLGSSVGVQKVETKDQLKETIENAFQLDDFVIVENGVIAREIEFAVFGNDHIQVFPPGEICSHRKIYNYESKYGENSMAILAKAPLPEKLLKQGMELAKKAYLVTGCNGFARVDFFLDEEENFWLNEINPIPGFTNTSLYPKICEENGLKTNDLIDQFIILGLHRKRAQQQYI